MSVLIQDLLPKSISNIFDMMGIAEEEIKLGMETYPESAEEINKSFLSLEPNQLVIERPAFYKGYCRELIKRIGTNNVSDEPTAAEYCMVLSNMSLIAPLRQDVMVAYWKCFEVAMPDEASNSEFDDFRNMKEAYPGASNEVLTDIKNKIRSKKRA